MATWVQSNLLYSCVIGGALVIVGAGLALKAGHKVGWVVIAAGVGLIVWAGKLKHLI